jgi:hypothetical protein
MFMKLFCAALLLLMISCNSTDEKVSTVSMQGVYKMNTQHYKSDKLDTTVTTLEQLKIFGDGFVMYANVNPADSASSFGIGTYTVGKDTVDETILFNGSSAGGDDTVRNFKLVIEKSANGYTQVIPEIGTGADKFKLTEAYTSVGSTATSALDGAWKEIKRTWIKGKDSTVSKPGEIAQYKVYYGGYCIWGHVWKDSANKSYSGIGFGKFTMNGNTVKESIMSSTYAAVSGKDFDISIVMNGKDSFTQTMKNEDGSLSIEEYERMKK